MCIIAECAVACTSTGDFVETTALQSTTNETIANETTANEKMTTDINNTSFQVQTEMIQSLSDLPKEIQNILYEGASFFNTDSKAFETIDSLSTFNKEDIGEEKIKWLNYIVRDIDFDGENELVVTIEKGTLGNRVVFDVQEGVVYEYQFNFRSMITIYDDNIIFGSSGAAASTFYTVTFDKGKINQNISADSSLCNNGTEIAYTIDGEYVTEEEFYEFTNLYNEYIIEIQWSNDNLLDAINSTQY